MMGYHICRDKKHQMPRGGTLPDQNAGRMKVPKQKHLGVFEKQQEGSCRCMATACFSSLKEDVEVALKSATRKTQHYKDHILIMITEKMKTFFFLELK